MRRLWTVAAYLAAVAAATVLAVHGGRPTALPAMAPVAGGVVAPPVPSSPPPWEFVRLHPTSRSRASNSLARLALQAATLILAGYPPTPGGAIEAAFPGLAPIAPVAPVPAAAQE